MANELRVGRIFPIGFHVAVGGNQTGITDNFLRPLDAAGIRFVLVSADAYPFDAAQIASASGIQHTIVWRPTNIDTPINGYLQDPIEAADEHYGATMSILPSEFDGSKVHLGFLNEIDRNYADWLGRFAKRWSENAIGDGYMPASFGWASGTPEYNHWLEPGMRDYLTFVSRNRDKALIMLHEYSYDVNDIYRWYPNLIGRYNLLMQACDEINIPRVPFVITEWGWEYTTVPEPTKALVDIDNIAKEYVRLQENYGAAIWYLGSGYNGIADKAQKLIKPVGDKALEWGEYIDWKYGQVELPGANTRYHLLRPREMSSAQWNFLYNKMTSGLQIPDIGHVVVGYEGWTHTDSISAILEAVSLGYTKSRLIIMDGHEIGTGLDEAWVLENFPELLPYAIWIRSEGGSPGPFEFKSWPAAGTPVVTQHFGANPDNYAQFGLPGHDGVDIRALHGTELYAVADGDVYRIETNGDAHNYGIHVRLQHQDGWKTIYAHMDRVASGLLVGQKVRAGQLLGYADNTGNSFGSHLHLGLKRTGYTYTDAKGNVWPYNIFDPTPFLQKLCSACFPGSPPPAAGEARLGLHASADPGLAAGEAEMFGLARIDMVKILSNLPPEHCARLVNTRPGADFVIRVFQDGWDRPEGISPSNFVDWNTSDVVRYMPLLDGRTVYIELHNEPNLIAEGWTHMWTNGYEFANWLKPVIADFRKTFQGKQLVFPGLSPGGDIAGVRYDSYKFVQEAAEAIALCDVLGVHVYWQKDLWPMKMALDQLDAYRRLFPNKPIIITEASNNRATTSDLDKGSEYVAFWRELRRRLDVLGVTFFVASSSNPAWGWESGTGEVWLGSQIPRVVGERT